MSDRQQLFDTWATYYDESLKDAAGFPFEGYPKVLAWLVTSPGVDVGLRILDLGTGTGALAAGYSALKHQVMGVDFSGEMLDRAKIRVPGATFIQADLLASWPEVMQAHHFDIVASAYLFHEFPDSIKLELVTRLAREALAPGGVILIGDIAFTDRPALEAARAAHTSSWDDDEHYWVADEALVALNARGLEASFEPVSFCAGILRITLERSCLA